MISVTLVALPVQADALAFKIYMRQVTMRQDEDADFAT
jgi:hypothetical protein